MNAKTIRAILKQKDAIKLLMRLQPMAQARDGNAKYCRINSGIARDYSFCLLF